MKLLRERKNNMDRISVKNEIENEINSSYRYKDLGELIDILLSVMTIKTGKKELAGIEERLYASLCKIFDTNTTLADIKLCLSNVIKVEPILKKILLLIDEEKYEKIQRENLGLAQVIGELGLNPENKKLDRDPESYVNDKNYMEHIARSYLLRNSEAHVYDSWTRREIYINLDSVLITCLRAVEINKKVLMLSIKKENINNELNIENYLNGISQQLKKRMTRFIHIRGEENFSVLGSYVVEYQDDNTDSKMRKGTVENLRDNSVPERRMMIWGEAGMGKTTTLEYLVYTDARRRLKDSNYNIPILILLGLLTKSSYTIKQYICDKLDIGIDICESLLEEGKINLFLDGLNEIPVDTDHNLKTLRMREIKQLLKDYPKTFIIITNRPQDTRDFNNVPIFNLIKLSKSEMEDFIDKNVSEDDVKKIIMNAINGNERFVQIINTPLILSRLIEIVRYKREIPHSEGEIIAEFLNCLLIREKEEKQDARLDIKRVTYLLRMIAFESLEKKAANSGMTESEVLGYCAKSMDTYRFQYDSLYAIDIALQLGILEKRENLYVFSHQAYQDYYYAMEELAVLQS